MKVRTTRIQFTLCLLVIAAVSALHAQTVGRPGGRSLRTRDLPQKAGATRQLFVAPDVDHVFPYILASGAWTTTFYLTNLEERAISVNCEFVSPNGEELPMKFNFSQNDESTAFTNSAIAAFSTATFHTVSTATALTTAWAYCSSEPRTDRFSGYAVVKNTASNGATREFITNLQPDKEPVFSVPFTDAASGRTALMLLNTALEDDSSLALWVLDSDGKPAGNGAITIKPGNLRVILLNDAFKDVTSGTVRVVNVEGTKYITGLALRTNAAGYAVFTPLTPKEAPPAPPEQ
jgi:anti-sigma-K factor RskA